jgi:hypothetical protein
LKRRPRFEFWSLLINVGALASVLSAIKVGASPSRLWPVAGFLFVSSAAALYVEGLFHLTRRRARNQSGTEIPRGVRLRRPFWISIGDFLTTVGIGATIGAVAAGLGAASVGLGILLTFGVTIGCIEFFTRRFSPGSLAFEPDGLRVFIRRASFIVRWSAITDVYAHGHEGQLTCLRILGINDVVKSVAPDTPQTRRRTWLLVSDGDNSTGKLTLTKWTAGLDAPVLARAINAAIEKQVGRVN